MARSPGAGPVSRWLWLKARAKAIGYGLSAFAILGFGTVAERNYRVIAVMTLAIIAIPILGFTLSQVTLTKKGREVARTVEDVRVLKEADARAFTQPFAAIVRKLPAQDVYPGRPWPMQSRTQITTSQHRGPVALVEPGGGQDPVDDGESPGGQVDGWPATGSFWASLTVREQAAFAAAAREQSFDAGVVLWRQNEHGDYAIVIRSGQTDISIEDALGERVIATRGPGDIVGERVAVRPGPRSATVVTATEVRAFVIGTTEFRAFIGEHPRVLTEVLEEQIYYRLTENQLDQSTGTQRGVTALRPMLSLPPWTGQNCSICLTDMTGFSDSSRRDRDRRSMRKAMYRMLEDAFSGSGVPWHSCYWEDRGDGALIIVPPRIPTQAVVAAVVVQLAAALRQHNRQVSAATHISLRVAIHVGPVTTDSRGVSGHAIDQAARLVEAAPLKRQIVNTAADLGLAASEFVYDMAISPNCGPDELATFRKIQFQAKKTRAVAWMFLSGTTNPNTADHLAATMRRPA